MSRKPDPMKYFSGSSLSRQPLYRLLAGGLAAALCLGLGVGAMAAAFTAPPAQATPETAAETVPTPTAAPTPTATPEPEIPTPEILADVTVVQQDIGVQLYAMHYEELPVFENEAEADAYVPQGEKEPFTGLEATVTLTDGAGQQTDYTVDSATGTMLAEDVAPGEYLVTVQPIEGYRMPAAESVTVKEKVVYKADTEAVKDKIVQSSEVNEAAEDSAVSNGGSAPIANEVKDTVQYAESDRSEGESQVRYVPRLSASGHMLLKDGTETPYLPVYDETTGNLTGAIRDPNYNTSGANAAAASSAGQASAWALGAAVPSAVRFVPVNETAPEAESSTAAQSEDELLVYGPGEGENSADPTPQPTESPAADPVPPADMGDIVIIGGDPTPTPAPADGGQAAGSTDGSADLTPTPMPTASATAAPDPTAGWPDAIPADQLPGYGFDVIVGDGTVYTGWQEIDGKTYYYDPDTHQPVTGQQVIQGNIYNFGTDGALVRTERGVDVSKFQGSIDWNAVAADGITFAIIRCGYRGYGTGKLVEDETFRQNIAGASAAGLKVGVYFYSQAVNEEEAVEEASMVLSLVSGYGLPMGVYYDTEYVAGGRANVLSAAERTACAVAFCETIRSGGYTPGVYSYASWFYNNLNFANISKYRTWIAQYRDTLSFSYKYDIWQYSSTGRVNGIPKPVDMNIGG